MPIYLPSPCFFIYSNCLFFSDIICSGRGECICGACHCFPRRAHSAQRYTGDYCQCDDYSCSFYDMQLCGGSYHEMSCDINFQTVWHFGMNRRRKACASPFRLRNSTCCSVSSLTVMHMRRLIRVIAGRTYHISGNLKSRLKFGPLCDKTCLLGFRQSNNKIRLLNYRDKLEKLNFTCCNFRYDTFQKTNGKGADQSSLMCKLDCDFVVRKPRRQVFLCLCQI